jgi:membrane-associated protease RseP (regulator of RpoE activity)
LFVLIESIRRKSISPKIANTINGIGFAILLFFMIAVSVSDIGKFFK